MGGIRYISSTIVQAANHKGKTERVELTPWDLQLLLVGSIQKGLIFPKPKQPQERQTGNYTLIIHHLNTSLSHTLDYFPPLSGRLASTEHDDDTISFFIDCNNAGALFVHAAADGVTISDILEPGGYVPHIVHSFFPLNGVKNYEGTFQPLLAVQVTELVDGIFIGCTINHMVVDGTSFWHFFNIWAEISRGSVHLSKPPVLQRWFLDGADLPIHIPQAYVKQVHEELFTRPPLRERVCHFTKENIAKLKAKANAEAGTDKISSLQALLSHIWQSVIRNKTLDPNEEINYRMLVGARPRLNELPEQYFGNAVQAGSITMKMKELLEQGLGNVAWEMNRLVATQTVEKLKKFLEDWTASPKLMSMGSMASNALVTSSSPWFNIYGNDFGWGRPVAVRSGCGNKHDGKITVLRGVDEGSIDIEACLCPDTLEAMANDEEFMEAVTISI
ncbi:hypothetical protein QQP08_000686 [Theobroma cacao]|nr:hypothetical protein QQP08_000686 [Theobroma cacao]